MKNVLTVLILCFSFILSGCQSDEPESNEGITLLKLEKKYGLKKVYSAKSEYDSLQVISVNQLQEFLEELHKMKRGEVVGAFQGKSIVQFGRFQNMDETLLPRLKTRSSESGTGINFVLIQEPLSTALGLISMNVWLNTQIPEVINSAITGITLFDSWKQEAADASRSGDRINFTVSGVWSFKIFVDGIGEFYTYPGTFGGHYDIRTNEGDLYIL